ncbi:unnamed protein product [Gongylonema pulchrum]|uniref:Tetraspanin n=1 Tax=Gongylonema pulchrum TaxID=637853 RepID=A0A183D1Z0_9BILA|nr:unnamed protein product [Gongylonema pulchrum]
MTCTPFTNWSEHEFEVCLELHVKVLHLIENVLAIFGCLCGISSCLSMHYDAYFPVYVIAVLLGAAQAVLLIASLSAVAELINRDTESGAFVYGILSSMDKLSNGLGLQAIELFSPPSCISSKTAPECASFYRVVIVIVPGSCLLIAIIVISTMMLRNKCCCVAQRQILGTVL